MNPQILLNTGLTRPFTCIAPEGTVVNPVFPAAVGMRSLTCARLRSLVFGAFNAAIAERLPAAPAGSSSIVNVMTADPDTGSSIIAGINPVVGGGGGMPHRDGADGSGADSAYLKNTPIEVTESEVPIRFERYGLLTDSGGAGYHRGGLATVMEFRVFAPNTRITVRNRDRTRFRPWGTLGGRAAGASDLILNMGQNNEILLGNTDIAVLEPGDVVHIHSPGGGGRGDPLTREPDRVALDVVRGYVSQDAAAALYGVAVEDGAVNWAATDELRTRLASSVSADACGDGEWFDGGPERRAHEAVWHTKNYDRLTEIMSALPIHWRFFVKAKLFEEMNQLCETSQSPDLDTALARAMARYPEIPKHVAR